jgi:hypothetical protein
MPNICSGFMNVRGYKDNVDEFVAILQSDYHYVPNLASGCGYIVDPNNFTHIPHFFRVFESHVYDESMISGVYKCASIDFEVAWSVSSCMFNTPFTYYNDINLNNYNNHFATHILYESLRLQLEIEIWSSEDGMAFQEHYKICSGVLVKDECYSYSEYLLEDLSFDEFKERAGYMYPEVATKEDYDKFSYNNTYITIGMHDEDVDFSQKMIQII